MIAPHKVILELDHVVLVIGVGPVHQFKEPHLNLSLHQKGFLVFDDFDGDVGLIFVIEGFDNLSE